MSFGHRHRFTPIAVNRIPAGVLTGTGTTFVLRRCRGCGQHDVEQLAGEWDASLFLPVAGAHAAGRHELVR